MWRNHNFVPTIILKLHVGLENKYVYNILNVMGVTACELYHIKIKSHYFVQFHLRKIKFVVLLMDFWLDSKKCI